MPSAFLAFSILQISATPRHATPSSFLSRRWRSLRRHTRCQHLLERKRERGWDLLPPDPVLFFLFFSEHLNGKKGDARLTPFLSLGAEESLQTLSRRKTKLEQRILLSSPFFHASTVGRTRVFLSSLFFFFFSRSWRLLFSRAGSTERRLPLQREREGEGRGGLESAWSGWFSSLQWDGGTAPPWSFPLSVCLSLSFFLVARKD